MFLALKKTFLYIFFLQSTFAIKRSLYPPFRTDFAQFFSCLAGLGWGKRQREERREKQQQQQDILGVDSKPHGKKRVGFLYVFEKLH